MSKARELIFEILLVSRGTKQTLLHRYTLLNANPSDGKSILPPKAQLLQWIGLGQMVEQNTFKMTEAGDAVVKYFHENGFACQILKGNTVGRYYPQPYRRSAGDIDIWLDGGRKRIYDFARAFDVDDHPTLFDRLRTRAGHGESGTGDGQDADFGFRFQDSGFKGGN